MPPARKILVWALLWVGGNVFAYQGLIAWEDWSTSPCRKVPARTLAVFKDRSVDIQERTTHFRLASPPRVDRNQKYPLLIFLHGSGGRGTDNCMHLQDFPTRFVNAYRDRFPCFCLVPQCPGEEWWDGYLAELDAMIDFMLKNPAVDQDRIYLVGVSLGGYGAWSLAAHRPGQFAAVVPICGGGDPGIATSLMKTPLWVIHGEIDRAVPVEEARAMVAAITDAGGNVKYSELAGVGHNSAAWAFDDSNGVFEWIFEQRRVDQTQTGNPLDRASH